MWLTRCIRDLELEKTESRVIRVLYGVKTGESWVCISFVVFAVHSDFGQPVELGGNF